MRWVNWYEALIGGAVSFGVYALLVRARPTRAGDWLAPWAKEFGFIAWLYTIWRLARQLPLTHEQGAIERAYDIVKVQDWLHLPSELNMQQAVIGHDTLVTWINNYYGALHVPVTIIFMVWLFLRYRGAYPRWRTVLALFTLFALVLRFVRVAPPRFLGDLGFIDLTREGGIRVYGTVSSGASDQFAAMPSIHVGWAAVVAFGIVAASTSRLRWLALLHLVLTMYVVMVTGHHWWLDGLVAIALVWLGMAIDTYGRRRAAISDVADTATGSPVLAVGTVEEPLVDEITP